MSVRRFSAVTLALALVGAMIAAVEEATWADTPASITTPKGSAVPDTYYRDEMSAAQIARANARADSLYPNATRISDASLTYNCHGYAWHMSRTGERVWIGYWTETAEDIYWQDGSYIEVPSEECADAVSYVGADHSAVPYSPGVFWSKWGSWPLMQHDPWDCPYYYATSLKYYARADDPAAEVEGFAVVNGVASWTLETLHRTESLALQGRNGKDEAWTPLAAVVPLAVGRAEVEVGSSGYEYFRLVETETTGKPRFLGEVRAQTVEATTLAAPRPRDDVPSLADAKARLEELQAQTVASGRWKAPMATMTGAPIGIYTRSALQGAVNSAIASFWTSRGYSVTVKLVDAYPSDPDLFRSALDADIAAEAGGGAGNFLLVGDANDWREFTQPWPGDWEAIRQSRLNGGYPPGEPARDLIPTWVVWDTRPRDQGMPYYNPYWFTDQPYADTNGDDLPDVAVGRLPFTTSAEVYAYATKLWDQTATWDADEIVYTIGNRSYANPGDGTRAREAAERTQQHIPGWVTTHTLLWSQAVYDVDRNLMPAALINTHEPGLLIQMASLSSRYYPGDFFDKTIGITPWTMGLLTTNKPMLIVSASCGGADYARTEKASSRPPVAEMFLLESSKGAVAWVGPTAGTWQPGNEAVVGSLIDELYTHPDQPMGTSFRNAIRRVLLENAGNDAIVATARSYEFLGDPLVPFMYNASPTDGPAAAPAALRLYANRPNPFNPTTTISFDLPARARASLAVYGVDGRLVATLADSEYPAGRHEVEWNGRDRAGQPVSTGVYFSALRTPFGSETRQMTLLK